MTNDEIKLHIQKYTGLPFLIGEYAKELGISWHRMRRIVESMVEEGELRESHLLGAHFTFYEPTGNKQRELLQETARRRAAWGEDYP